MTSTNSESWMLIVGLGNPGREHERNRHNVGFHCLDALAKRHELSFSKKQGEADLAIGRIRGQRVILLKPQTFVNLSGKAVGATAHFYKVSTENVLVVYDDLDLPQGATRLRPAGGSGIWEVFIESLKEGDARNMRRYIRKDLSDSAESIIKMIQEKRSPLADSEPATGN